MGGEQSSPVVEEGQRERLRRAAEDGERLYRVRMHGANGPSMADDNRIDGILTLDITDALGFADSLLARAAAAEASLVAHREALERIAENAESWHGPPPDCGHVRALNVIAATARAVLAVDGREEGQDLGGEHGPPSGGGT